MPDMKTDFARGRELFEQGRHALALEHFTVAADDSPDAGKRAAAAAFAAEISLLVRRPHETLHWAERLRGEGAADQAALLEALARVRLGEGEAALALLGQVNEPDTAYSSYPLSSRIVLRAQALALVGRPAEALAEITAALRLDPTDPIAWEQLALLARDPDLDPLPALAAVPDDRFGETLGNLATADPGGADRLLEVLWAQRPGDLRVLVLLAYVGPGLALERALEWSARMREHGVGEECPLLGIAATPTRGAEERVRAAAMASTAFDDPRATALIELAATAVATPDLARVLDLVGALAPELVGAYLVGAADGTARALALAAALRSRGASDAAVALVRHALADGHGRPQVDLPPEEVDALAREAADRGEAVVADTLRAAVAR